VTDPEGQWISDSELTELALSADPDGPLGADAVPFDVYQAGLRDALPSWYMPPVMAGGTALWRKPVVLAIVLSFLLVDAFGLCITFGQLVAARALRAPRQGVSGGASSLPVGRQHRPALDG
jgi:hypothetical protein